MQESEAGKPLFDIPRMAYTQDETAQALGVSLSSVKRLIQRGELKAVKIGRGGKPLVRIRPEVIAAFLLEREER